MLSVLARSARKVGSSCRAISTSTRRFSIFDDGGNFGSAQGQELFKRFCKKQDEHQPEFLQAVEEVCEDLVPVFERDPKYLALFQYIMEPERIIKFKVPWIDDKGNLRMNRGYRVQFNSSLGPYKGGLRFHPTVNESVLKFLGFEQIFKNSLTSLSLGGGKGGSDFDPKGKSEAEVARFCQSFMIELQQYIGPNKDVPAGDIGVGGREIGYLYGQYKRTTGRFEGVLTGKGLSWGGSSIRPEATGYGCVYYAMEAIKEAKGESLEGKRCTISGAGNVAQYTAENLLKVGAIPLTFSDSSGFIHEPNGFNQEQVEIIMDLKSRSDTRVSEYLKHSKTATFAAGQRPWGVPCDLAFPSATQNELDTHDAKRLLANGCTGVFEGANMPTTPSAIGVLQENKVVYGPGKAANAGGVAVSGLEMAQNAQMLSWDRDVVDRKLQGIMRNIHRMSCDTAEEYGRKGDLKFGANVAGFLRVASALESQGL